MEQIRRVMRPTDVRRPMMCPRDDQLFLPALENACSRARHSKLVLTLLDPRLRPALRPPLVRPRQGHHGLERKRPRSLVHFRARRRVTIPPEARHGPDLQSPPGRRRRLRILLEAPARDVIQRAQLLRRVRQRGRHDERRRESAVLLPGMIASPYLRSDCPVLTLPQILKPAEKKQKYVHRAISGSQSPGPRYKSLG